MNKIIIFLAALFLFMNCTVEEQVKNTDPIIFTVSQGDYQPLMGEFKTECKFRDGDKVGVFVNATREMPFIIKGNSLVAEAADIPQYFGNKAYAYLPATSKAESYAKVYINIPNEQSVSNGYNNNLLNMAAMAEVENGKVDFRFQPLGAIIDLGLSSKEEIVLSSLKVELPNPTTGSYLSGGIKVNYNEEGMTLDNKVSGGSNSIVVKFDDNLTLSSDVQYVPIAVLPFSSDGGGLKITLFDQNGNPCNLEPIWTDTNEISDNGAIYIGEGSYIQYDISPLSLDQFDLPTKVTIKVVDNKTSGIRANQTIWLYSIVNGQESMVGEFMTDEQGCLSVELSSGEYKVAAKYDDNTDSKWNVQSFEVSGKEQNVDFIIYSIAFYDDFDWITSDMGSDAGVVLKDLYESVNPPVANVNNQVVWEEANGEAKDMLTAKGWTLSKWVYLSPGNIRIGKKSASGTITFPKLSNIGSSNVLLTLLVRPWHTVSGGAWKLEDAQMIISIEGGASFDESQLITEYIVHGMESDAPSSPLKKNYFEIPIYNFSSNTVVSIHNLPPEGTSQTMYRIMFDEIKVAELY